MKEIVLGDKPHIDLCDLLKVAGMAPTGGVGKHFVAAGEVKELVGLLSRCPLRGCVALTENRKLIIQKTEN